MGMNITDTKSVTHKIECGKKYTVIFRKVGTNCRKIRVLNGLYQNYSHQCWIGHDSEDGTCDPLGDRVYFDGEIVPFDVSKKEILWVGTDDDWQHFLKINFI